MESKSNIFIEFTTTNNCNCRCKYCFENGYLQNNTARNIEEEKLQLSLIKKTCQKFDVKKYDWLTISFWGGEPMLNLDFIIKMIETTYRYPFVRYHIYSNGTLVEEYRKFLASEFINDIVDRLHVQLSYDGEPHHTIMRANNAEKVFQTANLLKQIGITCFFKATLSFNMLDKLPEIWKSYEQLYYSFSNKVRYSPTLDTTYKSDDKLGVWAKSLIDVMHLEKQFIKKHGHPLWDWFNIPARKSNCMLGNSIHVHNDGTIYICHGCAYITNNKKMKIATTHNIDTFFDIISNKYKLSYLPKQCIECVATHCQICHAQQLNKNDDPFQDWVNCRINNLNRCKYFKMFGFVSKYLRSSIIIENNAVRK